MSLSESNILTVCYSRIKHITRLAVNYSPSTQYAPRILRELPHRLERRGNPWLSHPYLRYSLLSYFHNTSAYIPTRTIPFPFQLLPGIEKITEGQAHTNTQKLYRNISTGTVIFINQKRVNVCEHMTKMASLESLRKVPPGGWERDGWREIIWG